MMVGKKVKVPAVHGLDGRKSKKRNHYDSKHQAKVRAVYGLDGTNDEKTQLQQNRRNRRRRNRRAIEIEKTAFEV